MILSRSRLRISKQKKYFYIWTFILTLLFIYGEFFTYFINSKKWLQMHCKDEKDCTKILLVADPQIIGNVNEYPHFITPSSIWDIDRFLKKTFSYAYNFVRPDVILFLGDLTDEAHIANDEDFHEYIRRIFDIFLDSGDSSKHVKHIWLPGDNDIGGEGDVVTPEKIKRFDQAFAQPDFISVKNVTFFKINRLTSSIPVYKQEREYYDTSRLFVGLSHVPLMFRPSPFVNKVINKMLPQLIFSAHEHKCMIISTDALLRQDYHITPVSPETTKVFKYSLGVTDMYEIMIPTCSYRMGTSKIGYGFAIIESNELQFTILWSPSRYMQLLAYLIALVLFGTSTMCYMCYCYSCRRDKNRYSPYSSLK